jgi:hypothetical protein
MNSLKGQAHRVDEDILEICCNSKSSWNMKFSPKIRF